MRIVSAGAALFVLSTVTASAEAQLPEPGLLRPDPSGVSVGLSGGTGSYELAGVIGLYIHTPAGDLVARGAGTSEFTIFGTPESVSDFAVMYGRRAIASRGWLSAAAGLGIVEAKKRGQPRGCGWLGCSHDLVESNAVGLAVQLDAVWAIAPVFGLGVTMFGNANSEQSFTGVALGVHLGRLR